ncbi:YkgJ family cysteine cluster protein [Anaeromicropila populeti]|uniref:Zinc-or iron-chelating domain-containing protein n=1 Tax=Anaeromicropila populeti TaxID=37658 RepID=A0A1I6IDV1_9FIRM|nr:YkgJ family cysteine cluster protein [Anaeromicropila populeti]SFR64863.1 hypothetical protein SAMN05661086_00739 [Anaeromicropila populeti]
MKRNCSLDEISDGKLYEINDLVEVSCNGCGGKASCCHGMGNSIILDPYDCYCLSINLNTTFEKLLVDKVQLNVVDGIILPNLRMNGSAECCAFLSEQGRCSIHKFRPGICRIFPLGRYYEDGDFNYILQVNECHNNSRTQRKVGKWIDTPDFERNKKFLIDWHYFLNEVEQEIRGTEDENYIKNRNLLILNTFYVKEYNREIDFYKQFNQRLEEIKKVK